MKYLLFNLIFCLPLLVSTQIMPRQFSKKEKSIFIQKNETEIHFLNLRNKLEEKFQLPGDIQERHMIMEEKILKSDNFNFSYNRELQLKLKEKMLKSAQSDAFLQDSIYGYKFITPVDSFLFVKIYMEYNGNGEMWSYRRWEWDSISNIWLNAYREDSYSDQNRNDTLNISYKWNSAINNWIPQEKIIRQYDVNGRRTLFALFEWHNTSQQWRGVEKLENNYDEWGNFTLYAYYNGWNDITKSWVGSFKEEYIYDEKTNFIFAAIYVWNPVIRNWEGNYKIESTFDANNNRTGQIWSVWDTDEKDWIYLIKQENEYDGNNLQQSIAEFYWDPFYDKWVGEFKYELYQDNEFRSVEVNYSWNIKDEMWEAHSKSFVEWNSDGTYRKNDQYIAKDSIIQTELINGFNNDTSIVKIWITPSCPDQTCTTLDSDFVEGDASILWNYNIKGDIYTTGGFCQVNINNDIDLSNSPGIAFSYKVIEPSTASVFIWFTETNGETWVYKTQEVLSDTTGKWIELPVSLADVDSIGKYVDGYFDTGNIANFQIRLHIPKGVITSGSILIDNFTACNIKKTDNWIPDNMTENWYNADGYFTSSVSSRWDPSSQEFIPYYQYKSDLSFDENGNLTRNYSYEWEELTNEWIWVFKFEAEYNESNNQTYFESLSWDDNLETWIGNQKQETLYDKFGNIIQFTDYQWEFSNASWQPVLRNENTWNEAGRQTSEANYNWDFELAQWIGTYRNEIFFNEFGEEIKTIYYEWDYDLSEWKISNIYLNIIYEEVFDEKGNLIAYTNNCWDENINAWSPSEKFYHFYSTHSITEAIQQELVKKAPVLIYPNPAYNQFKIQFTGNNSDVRIYLFSANGILVKEELANGNHIPVAIDNLPAGIYVLLVETNGNKYSQKVIITNDQ